MSRIRNTLPAGALLALVLSLAVAAPAQADDPTFSDLTDLRPGYCFSAPLSAIDGNAIDIGLETGIVYPVLHYRDCVASTKSFYPRSAADTFTATVTAPPGFHIARVHYNQVGTRTFSYPQFWDADGAGSLTAGGATLPFTFLDPNRSWTIDLSGQQVESTTVSVEISLSARRGDTRYTNPRGYGFIKVTDADVVVELAPTVTEPPPEQ